MHSSFLAPNVWEREKEGSIWELSVHCQLSGDYIFILKGPYTSGDISIFVKFYTCTCTASVLVSMGDIHWDYAYFDGALWKEWCSELHKSWNLCGYKKVLSFLGIIYYSII